MSDSNIITINRKVKVDFELEELYNTSFFEIAMNAYSEIERNKHDIILHALTPILSLKFYELHKEKAMNLVRQYKQVRTEDVEFLSGIPDEASCVDHVLKYYFKQFQNDKRDLGFEEALDKNQDFYFLCEEVYRTIPVSFVFSLINLKGCLK